MARNRDEMHEPVGVPANGRASSVPTRPSGSKSTRIEPVPVGSPARLHDARPWVTRSSSFVARARGNAPSTTGVVGVGTVGGVVTVGRTVGTVGAVPAIFTVAEG